MKNPVGPVLRMGDEVEQIIAAIEDDNPDTDIEVAVLALTPIEEQRVHARFLVTARMGGAGCAQDADAARVLAQKAKDRVIKEFETDLVIWEHKRYEPRPRLTAGEQLITRFRRWAQQFY